MQGLRGSVWLIVAAALLPLVLFVIFQVGYSAREQRRSVEMRALARSEAVILAADGRVQRVATAVDALATARSIQRKDWAEFRSRAAELAAISGGWLAVELRDATSAEPLVAIGRMPTQIEATGPPAAGSPSAFAGFARGQGCPCLMFGRQTAPVDGRRYALRVFVPADPFVDLLPSAKSEYPVSAIVGPGGRFIARTVAMGDRFGKAGSRSLRSAVAGGARQGIYRGVTLEGLENYTAFTRSALTGWSAHVALGTEYIDNPARRYLASLGIAAIVSLVLALLLVLFAIRQMAEARRVADRMQQAQKLEALGQLTGGIAHDFNNLLTPIVGSLEFILGRADLDERSRRLGNGGLSSARRAAKLTRQLLAFSRRQKLALEAIDLCSTLEEMRPMLEQSAGNDADLIFHLDCDHCWVETDPTQLELAMINLVLNARDASPPGGRIDIAVAKSNENGRDYCQLTVRDQGPGMSDEVLRRAFEPFFTTKPQGKGTGLGLAQVYALAQQSHGTVTIDSAPGAGTGVAVIFPVIAPPAPVDEGPVAAEESGRPARLLVVEDEADVREAIVAVLQNGGHEVDTAASGAEALDRLGGARFDMLIADFAMPGMNGAELIAVARKRHPALSFLIVTGYLDSAAVEAAAPGTPVIAKPFDSEALRRTVRQILAARGKSV